MYGRCFYLYSIRKTYADASYIKCTSDWNRCIMKTTKRNRPVIFWEMGDVIIDYVVPLR